MVTINYEPLEHLPYLDESISAEERSHVEQLIRVELANQFSNQNLNNINFHPHQNNNNAANVATPMHPLVDQILPLPTPLNSRLSPTPLLNQEIERYEQEQWDEDDDDEEAHKIMDRGIDLSKYSEFIRSPSSYEPQEGSSSDDIHYNNLYTTLSYASLQERNIALLMNNNQELMHLHQQHLQELNEIKEDYEVNVHSKRKKIEDVNVIRKKRQVVDFKPVNDYLNERWKDGIKSVVDLGIEASRMDMDMN
ncbi:uncharacterized protein RJT20DRAFT_136863 [Scheffersomyces xylosifermentans]|uniref:uncharacterized protein n=1 Tax=Scheffersomyces xylosifermentans TaxID=1304137 RepID=UPI00315C4D2E